MFDNESEAKKVVVDNKPSKTTSRADINKTIIIGAAAIGAMTIVLVFAIMLVLFFGTQKAEDPGGKFGGLQNPDKLTDPPPVSSQDIEDEYQSRPSMAPATPEMLEVASLKFLSKGNFTGLDAFLAEQMALYKNLEGDEGQGMEDWRDRFDLLRSDVAKVINIRKDDNPAKTFAEFTEPKILAAAVAWSPISVKCDAFVDWSSLILPKPVSDDIRLRVADLKSPNEMLAQINKNSSTRYYDLAAYDMAISGYDVRLIIVGDQFGYYRPWTIQDLDNQLNRDIWTKSAIQEVKNALDPWTSLDSVLSLPHRSEESIAEAKTIRTEHPEWFDQDGLYIGPSNEGTTLPAESQNPNGEEPIFLEPEPEDGTDNQERVREKDSAERTTASIDDTSI